MWVMLHKILMEWLYPDLKLNDEPNVAQIFWLEVCNYYV